jgi:hypothetical protein
MLVPRKLGILVCTVLAAGVLSTTAPATAESVNPKAAKCSKHNAVPFVPVKVKIAKIGTVKVMGRNRSRTGVPKAPPLTTTGKSRIAWDRGGVKPGSLVRHVLMNAHVWPDGSAVGDQLNLRLKRRTIVKVMGAQGQVQCYQVKKRKIGRNGKRLAKFYYGNATSKPRLAIVTCTGERLGPGNWAKRSVWLAKPIR